MAFQEVKTALGSLIGSNDIAGFILFGSLTVAIFAAFMIATSKSKAQNSEAMFFIALGLGVVLSIGFEWVPLWVGLILGLILVFLIFQPFSGKAGA